MKKKKIFYIAFMFLVLIVGLKQAKDLFDEFRSYSSNEILGIENEDFNSENVSFAINTTMDTPRDEGVSEDELPIIRDIVISREVEKELIDSFKNAKFKKDNEAILKLQYKVTFSVDSDNSSFWLNLDDDTIYMGFAGNYVFEDDNNFLNIFKEVVK